MCLTSPQMDPNAEARRSDYTLLTHVCKCRRDMHPKSVETLRVLLEDPRVKVWWAETRVLLPINAPIVYSLPDYFIFFWRCHRIPAELNVFASSRNAMSPVHFHQGATYALETLLVAGRFDLVHKARRFYASKAGQRYHYADFLDNSPLEGFFEKIWNGAEKFRMELNCDPTYQTYRVADLYILLKMFRDGYFRFSSTTSKSSTKRRRTDVQKSTNHLEGFMLIMSRLGAEEISQRICHLVYGSDKTQVNTSDALEALKFRLAEEQLFLSVK